MSNVQVRDLVKSYGATHVMHGVNLLVEDGEFVILVGPSGCGKSTLLRMIAGLEQISDGTVEIGSRVVNDLSPKDRNIAMVFQSYALYPHKTVAQNMGFSLQLAKVPKAEIDRKVNAAAEILDLTRYLDRFPKQLSGGQRQRVAMGRAIVRDPEVFLFDEPLSNLDAKLRVQMRTEIKALHHRLKTTIVYVTHDQIEAMTMADRIVVMNGGRIEQVGRPLDLYDRPINKFVAGFIGSPSMNFLNGTVEQGRFNLGKGLGFDLPPELSRAAIGRDCTAGIRPEHIELAPGPEGAIPAQVIVDEPTGAETQIAFRIGGMEVLAVFKDRVTVTPDQTLHLRFPTARLHLFDSKTGARINA